MFRRPGKSPLGESDTPSYSHQQEPPPRLFEPPRQIIATPMPRQEESWNEEKTSSLPHHFENTMNEEAPETTLGEGVTFRGELSFERLLRIDGTFEGELLSQGKVIVGPKGKVKANLVLREAVVEGEIEGDVTVQEKLELRGEASVKGDIKAKLLCVDEGVRIDGHVCVGESASY
ncbi:MAG: polymer-forming cytoskeletal protein [Chlamydiales bacterium]|nr:polymer-forming cytoskeletal protein [Chlamydiales bacterium]